jgi:hypothetical protein
MKVNIVLYENKGWIIDKFANEIAYNLEQLGYVVSITSKPVSNADIYHHLLYYNVDRGDFVKYNGSLHSIMVTHLDTKKKLEKVLSIGREKNTHLITMSDYYTDRLVSVGVPRRRISTVHAPKNESITTKKKLCLGIFSNFYDDGRKNEQWLISVLKSKPEFSEFIEILFYGYGWAGTGEKLSASGYNIIINDDGFNNAVYSNLMESIDYFIYLGKDEGSMAFLDAITKNKKVIAIPQGFQYDLRNFITYPIENVNDFSKAMSKICDKQKIINELSVYSWNSYTRQLLDIWIMREQGSKYKETLFNRLKSRSIYYCNRVSVYKDFGIK